MRIEHCLVVIFLGVSTLRAGEIQVPSEFPSIQAAIDASNPGDVILVDAGIYSERIVMKEGIHLRSAGADDKGDRGLKRAERTVIDGGGEAGDSPGVTMAEGATLDGFTVTGVGRYDETIWQTHWDGQGEDQDYEEIGSFGTPGIAVTGVNCTIINNIVHHVGATGIAISGAERGVCRPYVAGNVCYRNMGGGIGSMKGSSATISGNVCFENLHAGIGHEGADPLVLGNECFRNIRAGIGISEGASPIVRENRCYENRRSGIGIRTGEGTRPLIESNECFGNEMAGIASESEAQPVIRNNRCYDNRLVGIGCRDASFSIIVENECQENEAAGIGIDSASAVLLRNRIEGNGAAGIGVEREAEIVAIGNICRENRLVGAGIRNGSRAVLRANTFERTGGMPPMIAILGNSEAVLDRNTVSGGGVAGVLVEGTLEAVGNAISGAGKGVGVLAKKDSRVFLRDNRVTGFQVPLKDDGATSFFDGSAEEGQGDTRR